MLAMATDGVLVWMDIFSHVPLVMLILNDQGGRSSHLVKTNINLLFLSYISVGVKKTLQTY